MGGAAGLAFGVLFGGFSAIRGRLPFGQAVKFIGASALGSAATMSVFMGIGAFTRC